MTKIRLTLCLNLLCKDSHLETAVDLAQHWGPNSPKVTLREVHTMPWPQVQILLTWVFARSNYRQNSRVVASPTEMAVLLHCILLPEEKSPDQLDRSDLCRLNSVSRALDPPLLKFASHMGYLQ